MLAFNLAGVNALKKGTFPEAIRSFQTALDIALHLQKNNQDQAMKIAIGHHNLARAHQRNNNLNQAFVHFSCSREVYLALGKNQEAEAEKQLMLEIKQSYAEQTKTTNHSFFSMPNPEEILAKLETEPHQEMTQEEQQLMKFYSQTMTICARKSEPRPSGSINNKKTYEENNAK